MLYPVLLFVFPEPADAFGPDGPRLRPGRTGGRTSPSPPSTSPESPRAQRKCCDSSESGAGARGPIGPIDASKTPRFAGPASFARLPRLDQVPRADVAVVGVPFDSGVSYRPGRPIRPDARPRGVAAAAAVQPGAGRVAVRDRPGRRRGRHRGEPVQHSRGHRDHRGRRRRPDQRRHQRWSPSAATTPSRCRCCAPPRPSTAPSRWCTSTRTSTPGTPTSAPSTPTAPRSAAPSRRASSTPRRCRHVGTRGPLYGKKDLEDDRRFGFGIVTSSDVYYQGVREVVDKLRQRLGNRPVYVSIDIDVLDPAHAPGTGTPEAGGMTSRELLEILRGFRGLNLIGADVVEVVARLRPRRDHRCRRRRTSPTTWCRCWRCDTRSTCDGVTRNGGDVVVETLDRAGGFARLRHPRPARARPVRRDPAQRPDVRQLAGREQLRVRRRRIRQGHRRGRRAVPVHRARAR